MLRGTIRRLAARSRSAPLQHRLLSTAPATCWSCQAPVAPTAPVCPACSRPQPISPTATYYDALAPQLTAESLPSAARLWHIDRKALKQQFLALQRRVHPDAFAAADARVREYSDAQSAFLNKAHNELQHALSRAKYLLKLYGGSVEEDESALPASQELLLYMMDTQEVLEECEEPTQVEDIARENDERISQCLQALSDLFERLPSPLASDQAAVATRQQVQQLKDLVVRLQYLQQLQSAVSDKKHSLSS